MHSNTHFIRTTLIGAGFIGTLHARNLAAHPGIELVSIVEPNQSVGAKLADQYRTTWTGVMDEALADPSIDAIWIASPAATHSDFIRRAAAAGKAIFCEKPVGIDLADVDRLVGELKDYGKPIMIGFNRRFDASHAALKAAVSAGRIGTIEHVTITSRDPKPPPIEYIKATPGGIFYDTMIHDFDIARWILGEEPTEVYSTASVHLGPKENPDKDFDAATTTLKTSSGAVCQIAASRRAVYGYDQRIEVFGSEGMVVSENPVGTNVRVFGREAISGDTLKEFFVDRYAEAYVREIDAFAAAVRCEPANYPNLPDGREALFLSLKALESARKEAPVRLLRAASGSKEESPV